MRSKLFALALALVLVAGAALATAYVADIQGGTQFKQSSIGTTPALCGTFLGTTSYQVCLAAAVSSAAWNPIVVANDSVLVFNAGAISTGALDIVPHSSSSVGLRMTNSGSTFSGALTSNGSVLFAGGATASGSTAIDFSGSSAAFKTSTGAFSSAPPSFSVSLSAAPSSGTIVSPINFGTPSLGSSPTLGQDFPFGSFSVTNSNSVHMTARAHINVGGSATWSNAAYCWSLDVDATEAAAGNLCFYNAFTGINVYAPTHILDVGGTFAASGAATFGSSVQIGGGTTIATSYHGACSLNGASPSVCTATVASTSTCVATARGTTAAAGVGLATSISSTTLTITGPNGSTLFVTYVCL